jgi:hypothetical protein
LANEAGECTANQEDLRTGGAISERRALQSELGDVLVLNRSARNWACSDQVAEANIAKLLDRLERGKIKGDGDQR